MNACTMTSFLPLNENGILCSGEIKLVSVLSIGHFYLCDNHRLMDIKDLTQLIKRELSNNLPEINKSPIKEN